MATTKSQTSFSYDTYKERGNLKFGPDEVHNFATFEIERCCIHIVIVVIRARKLQH